MNHLTNKLSGIASNLGNRFTRFLFWGHESLVRLIHGKSATLTEMRISEELLSRIEARLETCGSRSMNSISERVDQYPYFFTGYRNSAKIKNWDENLIISDLHEHALDDPLVQAIHEELRQMFSAAVNSPFAIVNTRMWTTRPGAHRFGPNAMHNDQFLPGHLKIMIYVTPMNDDYGFFVHEGGEVRHEERGWTLCFANSGILHSGVPGTTQNRTCLETTIQRSLVDRPQKRNSFFLGRHYRNPFSVYL